jgi:hypothetical protein
MLASNRVKIIKISFGSKRNWAKALIPGISATRWLKPTAKEDIDF